MVTSKQSVGELGQLAFWAQISAMPGIVHSTTNAVVPDDGPIMLPEDGGFRVQLDGAWVVNVDVGSPGKQGSSGGPATVGTDPLME